MGGDPYERQKALLAPGDYSDLIITRKAQRWNVHKAIICPRSKFFAASVRFPVGTLHEVVDPPDDDPHVVERTLTYLYDIEYDLLWESYTGHCFEIPHIHFDWSLRDDADRAERLKVHYSLERASYLPLKNLMGTWMPPAGISPDSQSKYRILDNREILNRLSKSAKLKAFHDTANTPPQDPYNPQDLVMYHEMDVGPTGFTLENAAIYRIADKYDVPDLRELAYIQLQVSLIVPVRSIQVKIIMVDIHPYDKKMLAHLSARIYQDMDMFGIRDEIRELLDKDPELGKPALEVAYD
ncbi:uncharacterized protein CC84DRAFT_1220747 [Paraphaeosphaeria sporulosa]|uniref:BTB domain-containing protein n=1 Tax=Paraphaeosphaeria sporulosa TaxID=1460663 RepID=A0A177C464_9PLEO|nr:uncharacterized protein CC84DRAFT_1220747 [Paraphaeosphaeria sporulosa]OAG02423.1 hypothetical protein CC84DRAFT_1220747 [Paraphaeosphaeria sporulosa]